MFTISWFFCVALVCVSYYSSLAQQKIVILGSSTAAGSGASSYSNSWVGKLSSHYSSLQAGHTVTNLAVGGYNTYQILPTGTPHPGRPGQDTFRNITSAVAVHKATTVIVNMPSNDVANSYGVDETLSNYRKIKYYCDSAGVRLFITTSQPRNFADQGKLGQLIQIKDSTVAQYGNYSIDFWTTIANADGTINPSYNADGIHVNDAAHEIFFQRVKAKPIINLYALPIRVSEFLGLASDKLVRLTWQLPNNDNETFIEVQRSLDGRKFLPITLVRPTAGIEFSAIDSSPTNGFNLYRLKLFNTNETKFSEVLRITFQNRGSLMIYPNPVHNYSLNFHCTLPADALISVTVYNGSGTEVFKKYLAGTKGLAEYCIGLPRSLDKGFYFICVDGIDAVRQRFVIQ